MKILSWDVGLRTLSYCIVEGCVAGDAVTVDVHAWDAVDVQVDADVPDGAQQTGTQRSGKRKKMETVSIEDGAKMLCDALHRRHASFDGVDVVIIEQQPAGGHNRHSNVRMKVMSHVIQMYFYTRGLHVPPAPAVTFVSPSSKLVEMDRTAPPSAAGGGGDEAAAAPTRKTISQQYTRNKKFAVAKAGELVQQLLPADNTLRRMFEAASTAKKDDLADAFLLGYYYALKHVKPSRKAQKRVKARQASL
jgi:hypothetical protein